MTRRALGVSILGLQINFTDHQCGYWHLVQGWIVVSESVSHSVLSNSSQFHGLLPTRLLCPWDSTGKNTGVGSHSLLQGIFPIQGSNPGLAHCRQTLYHLNHQGTPNLSEKGVENVLTHAKSWLIGKDFDAGRDWGQEKKGMTEDEMARWHHWLDGRESEWTPGVGDGQGGLACCDSWGRKESDTIEWLNWTEANLEISGERKKLHVSNVLQ